MIERPDSPAADLSLSEPARLPRRDLFLLPLLGLLTILVMFGVSETVTRLIWPWKYSDACNVKDAVQGLRFKPNCTVRGKIPEGPWITYRYNECGYRSESSCGPKPLGTIRIAILGSSMSQALHVQYEEAFFSRAATSLSRLCDRRIDVQNLGMPGSSPAYADRKVQEVLALNPDVVLYMVVPYDLNQQTNPNGSSAHGGPPAVTSSSAEVQPTVSQLNRLERLMIQSRTLLVAQHFVFQNRETFIRAYLMYGDKADYLRQPLTPIWQQRFADLDLTIGDIANRLHAAGVPLMIVAVPSRAEAALLSSPQLPAHVDPFAFGREIHTIASKHGAGYVDLMGPLSRIRNAENLYYVVDGHVTAEGHKVIAEELVQKLQDGSVPAFSSCTSRQSAQRRP
jgi:SGNH hydrolase-like domain, acetyltransferase AlgX